MPIKKENKTQERGLLTTLTTLPRLEEKNGDLAEVEVDEVLRLVGNVRAEVAANDCVPRRVVLLVELLLDVGGDVLFDVELLHGLGCNLDGVGLHVLGHVGVLDDGFAVGGGHSSAGCWCENSSENK